MIILPQTHVYRALSWVPKSEWREPSRACHKDQFGNREQVRFRLTARLNDGAIRWRGWFDSREEADAFLWALARHLTCGDMMPQELWRLPTPAWHPDIAPFASYDFATLSFLTSTSATDQTYNVPSDWNSANNSVEVVASGGSGGGRRGGNSTSTTVNGGGGGGAGYAAQTNISLTPSGTATYRLPAGGAQASSSGQPANVPGNDGADAWFNGTTLAGSSVGAKAGLGGSGASGLASGGSGGGGAGGVGATKTSGGDGGDANASTTVAGGGGGGAGGPSGSGTAGGSRVGVNGVVAGGAGGGPNGGAGSSGANGSDSSVGGTGTTWDGTHGTGGGAGSAVSSEITGQRISGAGGAYGAGGGGCGTRNTAGNTGVVTVGAGGQALIVITYTPLAGPLIGGSLITGTLIRGGRLA